MTRRGLSLLLALVAIAAAAAGCGGKSSSKSPLDDALGYMPQNSLVIVAIKTDPKDQQFKNASALLDKFPFAGVVKDRIKQALQNTRGVNYDSDIKPLLGNDAVIGVLPRGGGGYSGSGYVVAWQTKGGDIGKQISKDSQKVGSEEGATLYRDSSGTLSAVKDKTLIVAKSRPLLDSALRARNSGSRMSEANFVSSLNGLSQGALVRITGDFQKILASSTRSAQAVKVPWVAALRTFGATASIDPDGISIDFKLRTKGVTDSQVPLATGIASPPVVRRPGEFAVAARNPAQVVKFAEQVAGITDPKSLLNRNRVGKQLGVDIDRDVVAQLGGNSAGSFALDGSSAVRADLKNAGAFRSTLATIMKNLPKAQRAQGKPASTVKSGPGSLYTVTKPGGKPQVIGVIGKELVIATDAARARAFASASASPVSGLSGSVAFTADPRSIVAQVLKQRANPAAAALLGPALVAHLQSLDGSVDTETSGILGHLKLTVR